MRLFSRIGLISAIAFSPFGHAPFAARLGEPPGVVGVMDGRVFRMNEAAGAVLAVHFLPESPDAEGAALVREYSSRAATVAGVKHLFVTGAGQAGAKEWAARAGDAARFVYLDEGGALAGELGVAPGAALPVTVVLGTDGRELFRHAGSSAADSLKFADFAARLDSLTRRPTLSDYNLPKGNALAVDGYDVVAYFVQGKAVKGKPDLVSSYRGVTYRFSSPEMRERFAADPERYLPTYGGWCASAMGDSGKKVEIDPENFKVKDGRLFLFYKSFFGDALKDWNKREKEWEPAADRNWKKLTGEDPVKPGA